MKQSKRFLSVLLAMVLILTTFTIGASAYKTNYDEPAGYDSVLQPYFTNDQAASALMDMLDDKVFAPMNVHESVAGIDLDIYSYDSLCDSIDNVQGNWLYGAADFFVSLGDIEKLDTGNLRNKNYRRRSATLSDFQLFMIICQTLAINKNASVLSGIFDGSFSLGIIDRWFNLYEKVPMLKNVHGYVCDMVYKLLINDNKDTGYEVGSADNYNLDSIVQNFLNNRVLTFVFGLLDEETVDKIAGFLSIPVERDNEGKITNQMGLLNLLHSLSASDLSLTNTSTYDFLIKVVNALVDDIVIPFAGSLLMDLLKIGPDDYDNSALSYVDIAIGLFVDYDTLVQGGAIPEGTPSEGLNITEEFLRWKGVENPERPKPLDKINVTLEYIIKVGIKKFIYFKPTSMGSHLQLTEYFAGMFTDLIKMLIPMLPSFTSDFAPLTDEQSAALETMTDEQVFAFLARMLLEAFVDGVYFPDDCDSIKELATYTLVNICEELVHSENVDFQKQIEQGTLDPDSVTGCLNVAAAVINYYLVGQTTFESSNPMPTFERLLSDTFDTFLGKYAALFSMYPNQSAQNTYKYNPWYKLYRSVNQWIPLTNIFYGVEDSWQGMQNLFMDSIIGNVLNFDINGLLGIIGRRSDSDLNKPLSKLLSNLLARVLNGVFKLPVEQDNQHTNSFQLNSVIIPYDYTTLDQILQTKNTSPAVLSGTGLKNTVYILFKNLPNITQSGAVAAESLDLICELVGIIKLKDFDYQKRQFANNFSGSYNMNQLKALYEEYKISDNEGIEYDDADYVFCHTVDFEPWTYKEFKKALKDAKGLIESFENGESVARADITYTYYLLNHLHDDWLLSNQPAANDFYLRRIVTNNPRVNSNDDGSGNQLYTSRSWYYYEKAYNFAESVMAEYNAHKSAGTLGDYPQSKVNTARSKLRDAIQGLKLNAGLGDADYAGLIAAIGNLVYLDSPAVFTEKSVQNVIEQYNEALAFLREVWYDADSQQIVDGVTERLNKAYGALVTIPVLSPYDPDDSYFLKDEVNSYLYGFLEPLFTEADEEDFGDFTSYMDQWLMAYATNDCTEIKLISTANGNGTGARVQLCSDLDGDGVFVKEREYTVIFFGDVTGDGNIDGTDAVLLRCFASRMLTVNNKTAYLKYAGDIDCDDIISSKDANAVINAGVFKQTIDQAPAARADNQITFSDLVNH